jgi:hypothetical protein
VSVALVILHAKHMCPIILPSVAYLPVSYFPSLTHKRDDFRKKSYWTCNVRFVFSTALSETFFNLRGIEGDVITNVHTSLCKVPLVSDSNVT